MDIGNEEEKKEIAQTCRQILDNKNTAVPIFSRTSLTDLLTARVKDNNFFNNSTARTDFEDKLVNQVLESHRSMDNGFQVESQRIKLQNEVSNKEKRKLKQQNANMEVIRPNKTMQMFKPVEIPRQMNNNLI